MSCRSEWLRNGAGFIPSAFVTSEAISVANLMSNESENEEEEDSTWSWKLLLGKFNQTRISCNSTSAEKFIESFLQHFDVPLSTRCKFAARMSSLDAPEPIQWVKPSKSNRASSRNLLGAFSFVTSLQKRMIEQSNYIIESIKLLRYRLIKSAAQGLAANRAVIDVLPLRISSSAAAASSSTASCAKQRFGSDVHQIVVRR